MATCSIETTYAKDDEEVWENADDLWELFMTDCYENPDDDNESDSHFQLVNSEQYNHAKMAEDGCKWISLPHPSKTLDIWVNGLKWAFETFKMHPVVGDMITFDDFYKLMKYEKAKEVITSYVNKVKQGAAHDTLYESKKGKFYPKGKFSNLIKNKQTVAVLEDWLISKQSQKSNQSKDRNSSKGSQSGSNPSSRSNTPNTSQIPQTPTLATHKQQPQRGNQVSPAPTNTPPANQQINPLDEVLRTSQASNSPINPPMAPPFFNNSQHIPPGQNVSNIHLGPLQQRRPNMKTTYPASSTAQHNNLQTFYTHTPELLQTNPSMNNSSVRNNPNITPNVTVGQTSSQQQNFQQNQAFMQAQNRLRGYGPYVPTGQPSQSMQANASHQQPPSYAQHQQQNTNRFQTRNVPPGSDRANLRPPQNQQSMRQQQQAIYHQQPPQQHQQRPQRQGAQSAPQSRPPPSNRPPPRNGQVKRMIPPEYEIELSKNRRVKRELIELPKTGPIGFPDAKSLLESPLVTSSTSKIERGDIFIATIKGKRCYFKKKVFLVLITNPEWIAWCMANPHALGPAPPRIPQWIPLPPSGESIQCEIIGTVAPNLA